jgi:predicted HTH transcriptional regulator
VSNYIKDLIREGEHQQLDFKFEVSDFKKIARSLVAFANTDGGRLLIGVKDNGAIAGVRSEEEFYMIEGAAKMHCKPEVRFQSKEYNVDGRLVMEIKVSRSEDKPHLAPDKDGKWKVFVRVNDQNLVANKVLRQVWKHQKNKTAVKVRYKEQEEILFKYLQDHSFITLSQFCKIAKIPPFIAEKILVNFILLEIIEMHISEKTTNYSLKEKAE